MLRSLFRWNSAPGTMAVRMAGMGVNFLTLALVARWAGQENLGIVISLNGAAFFGGTLCALGLPMLLLKNLTGDLLTGDLAVARAQYRRAIRLALAASAVAVVLAIAGAAAQAGGLLPRTFGSIGPTELLALAVCSAAMAVQALGLSAVRALRQPALSGAFQFCTPPLLLLLSLAGFRLVAGSLSPLAVVSAVTLSMLGNAILVHHWVTQRLPATGTPPLEPIAWTETRALWVLNTLSAASANIPLMLAAVLLDPASVALLGVPFRICNLPMTVVAALGAYYAPLIREAHLHNDTRRQRRQLVESQWIGVALVAPVLIVALIAPEFVLHLFSIHGSAAVRLFLVFAVAQTLIAACGVSEQYLAMLDQARWAARITQWSLAGIVLSAFILPRPVSPLALALTWSGFAMARQIALWSACIWGQKKQNPGPTPSLPT